MISNCTGPSALRIGSNSFLVLLVVCAYVSVCVYMYMHVCVAEKEDWDVVFNLFLYLKWAYCRQHIVESCFFLILSDNLCLLIDTFRPFTFTMIIDIFIFGLISTIFITFPFHYIVSFFFFCPVFSFCFQLSLLYDFLSLLSKYTSLKDCSRVFNINFKLS